MSSDRKTFWKGVLWALRILSLPSLIGVGGGLLGSFFGWIAGAFIWSMWSSHWKWPVPNYGVPIGFILGACIGIGMLLCLEYDELAKQSTSTQ